MNNIEEDDENDVIDRIRAKQKLTASHIVYVVELLIKAYGATVSLIDPGFIAFYMNADATNTKPCADMMRFFKGDRQRPVTIMPIHDNNHWSLIIYVARYNTFYYFDSLEEYHNGYITRIMRKMVKDMIITDLWTTQITTIGSDTQAHSYECGQYLFMFIYSFFVQYNQQPSAVPFTERLQSYVGESCRENHRQSFIRLVIAWIHESRGY